MNTSNKPMLIGLAGTNGAGKDSVGELLEKEFGYIFVSGSDLLREEAARRGLSSERETLRTISNEWRTELGNGAIINKVLETRKGNNTKGFAIASIRSPGEADAIHERGGIMIWLDADKKLRYERITNHNRGRSDDKKTFEEFVKEEAAEMYGTTESKGLNVGAVKEKCDYFIQNDTSWGVLKTKLAEIIGQQPE